MDPRIEAILAGRFGDQPTLDLPRTARRAGESSPFPQHERNLWSSALSLRVMTFQWHVSGFLPSKDYGSMSSIIILI